jgi:polysaccharide export outer membrane protein
MRRFATSDRRGACKWKRRSLTLLISTFAFAGGISTSSGFQVLGQQAGQTPPIARLDNGATGEDTRYRIGPGDVLTIVVRKASELSGPVRVDQRGMIRIPMIDHEIRAACRTESELASEITTLYLQYKNNPNVEVFVTEFQSRPVSVIGAVNSAGQFRLQRQVRLLELLTFAGGPSIRAGRTIDVVHAGGPSVCENPSDVKETDVADQIQMYKLTDTLAGKQDANPLVQPGDIIQVPEADQVFIIGHVVQPQAIPLRDKPITLSRALAMVGGPARDGKTDKIKIVRQAGATKQEIYVNLKDVEKLKAEDIALLPNDIVEVPSSTGKTILGILTGAVGPTVSGAAIRAVPGVP